MIERDNKSFFKNIDKLCIVIYFLLLTIGWISVYAAVYNEQQQFTFDFSQAYIRQFFWIGTAFILGLTVLIIDPKFISTFAYLFYAISIFILIFVLLAGTEVSGAKSWFKIGAFALQPGEFAKLATAIAIAKFLSNVNLKAKSLETFIRASLFLIVPILLILKQNDTGSAMVFVSFILVFYREGLNQNIIIGGLVLIFISVMALLINNFILIGIIVLIAALYIYFYKQIKKTVLLIILFSAISIGYVLSVDYVFDNVLEKHQKTRVNVLLGKEIDLKGTGYNINQSKIAIGSGGFKGKGFLKGTQTKFNFVPEQSTDFIFCTIGEEWGFVGTFITLGLYVFLLIRLIIMAERQRSSFARIFGYCVACILFFHVLINIGMTIGLFPVIGIPLPFISYGGSSMWAFTLLLFIFIKQDSQRYSLL